MKLSAFNLNAPEDHRSIIDQVVYSFNATDANYPSDKNLVQIFEDIAQKYPGHIAVTSNEQTITYQNLEREMNSIAAFLINKNVIEGQVVALLLDHSIQLIASILGTLKAGCIYMPLDARLPYERIQYQVQDTGAMMLISQRKYIGVCNKLQWECASLRSYICVDAEDVLAEIEQPNELMNENFWSYIGNKANDAISLGGWFSSYTGKPFSAEEMDEYQSNAYQKLQPYLSATANVLEIGCSSGLTLFTLAPYVGAYYGTDLSAPIIAKTQQRVQAEGLGNVHLLHLQAHEIQKIGKHDFDIAILNSVIQHFSGHNYLRQVIGRTIDMLSDTAVIFIGDILDLDMKEAFLQSLRAFESSNPDTGNKVKLDWTNELFVSKSFFYDLKSLFPEIDSVIVSSKSGVIKNELTEYRYDVILKLNKSNKRSAYIADKYQYGNNALNDNGGQATIFPVVKPGHGAYIIYTSGSTGQPKGCAVTHQNVIRLILNDRHPFYFTSQDVWVLAHSCTFDVSVWEIFGSLLYGARLVIAERSVQQDTDAFFSLITREKVTVLNQTPSAFNNFIECELMQHVHQLDKHLRYIIFAGEKLQPAYLQKWTALYPPDTLALINMYGITETTVHSTFYRLSSADMIPDAKSIVGKPLPETRIYIVDEDGKPAMIGVAGEIWVGGTGVSAGYINNPELTVLKFIDNPFGAGRVYKSGDIARWLDDGNIEYMGRKDKQIKIRGYRVEVGEVEQKLLMHPSIQACIVSHNRSGDGLTAFIVLRQQVDVSVLRSTLGNTLPEYMIPATFVFIEKMPLTANGKVDMSELRVLEDMQFLQYRDIRLPRNKLEKDLCEIWKVVLKKDVGIEENFFEIGGHSLNAFWLASLIKQKLGMQIEMKTIFLYPTIELLSHHLGSGKASNSLLFPLGTSSRQGLKYMFLIPPATGSATVFSNLAETFENRFICYGMQYPGFDSEELLPSSIEMLAGRLISEIEWMTDSEEICMVGYSMGALVAFEAARQLEQKGKRLHLILLDKMIRSESTVISTGYDPSNPLLLKELNRDAVKDMSDDIRRVERLYRHNLELIEKYRIQGVINADILAVEASDNHYESDIHLWKNFCSGLFEHTFISCTHEDILEARNIPVLASQMNNFLKKTMV